MAHVGDCVGCGVRVVDDVKEALARRRAGETIACDAICAAAAPTMPLFAAAAVVADAPPGPPPSDVATSTSRCRHRMGTVGGRCPDCGAIGV